MDLLISPQLIPLLAFGAVFLLVVGLQQSNQRSSRLEHQLGRFANGGRKTLSGQPSGGLFRQRRRLSSFHTLDMFLERKGFAAGIDKQLASAALPLRVGEYLLIRWLMALGLGATAAILLAVPFAAVPAAAVGYMLPAFYVGFRKRQRNGQLEVQLVDALALMAGGLRAGYSFLQGAEAVVRELPSPIRDEFGTLLQDLRVGVSMEEAIIGLARRVPSEEVDMLATAILIQRSSGGNLAEILDSIAYTIRERLRIRREIMTLTAQERMSSYVVGALPLISFTFLKMTNPDYLDQLFATSLGHLLLGLAIVLEIVGFYVIRKIIDIKI
jgi:tight adherence protein B